VPSDAQEPRPGNFRLAPRFEEPGVAERHDYLIASQAEIARILRSIETRNCPVAIYFGGEEDFTLSRIVEVDPDGGWLSFAFGMDKHANSRLLAARRVGFVCADQEAKVEFLSRGVTEVTTGCTIRLPFRTATVDLKIMHSSVIVLENGKRVRHSGCQFLGEQRDLKALIARFIVDLSNA